MSSQKRFLPPGGIHQLREALAGTREALKAIEAGPRTNPDGFAAQFARELEQREIDRAHAADAEAKEAARRARENPTERTIKQRVTTALEARGWIVRRRQVVRGWMEATEHRPRWYVDVGVVGEPDLEVLPGRGLAVFIELKSSTGRVSPEQRERIAELTATGYVAGVARTPDEAVALVERALRGGR